MAIGRGDEAAAWLERHPARGQDGFALPDIAWLLTRAKLARHRGEDAAPWLRQVGGLEQLPPALQLQCEVALATLRPTPHDALAALAQRLQGLGMRGLQRSVQAAAARAALAEGRPAQAREHAHQALALAAHVDAWIDDPASAWQAAAEVLQACGEPDAAASAARTGARWVQAHAVQWTRDEDRRAWLEGQPAHRALLHLARTLPRRP
jgi:cob(I)alamin adenosyltransferase